MTIEIEKGNQNVYVCMSYSFSRVLSSMCCTDSRRQLTIRPNQMGLCNDCFSHVFLFFSSNEQVAKNRDKLALSITPFSFHLISIGSYFDFYHTHTKSKNQIYIYL